MNIDRDAYGEQIFSEEQLLEHNATTDRRRQRHQRVLVQLENTQLLHSP